MPSTVAAGMENCFRLHVKLMNHKWAGPFLQPVDPVAMNIPDYLEIIKEPMDFSTIQKNIEERAIVTRDDFAAAVRLVFDNAFKYNKPGDDV